MGLVDSPDKTCTIRIVQFVSDLVQLDFIVSSSPPPS